MSSSSSSSSDSESSSSSGSASSDSKSNASVSQSSSGSEGTSRNEKSDSRSNKDEKASKSSQEDKSSVSSSSSGSSSGSSSSSSKSSKNSKDDSDKESKASKESGTSSASSSSQESSSSEDEDEGSKKSSETESESEDGEQIAVAPLPESRYNPLKDYFTDLPEPPVSKRARIPGNAFITQTIRDLSNHVKLIQKQEVKIMNEFTAQLASFGKDSSKDDEEETTRLAFVDSLNKIREKRKRFRGLLYDAIKQRNSYVHSYEIQQSTEKEKEEQLKNLGPKKGADFFSFTLIAAQAAIIILYLVFFDFAVTRELTIENMGWPLRVENNYSMYTALSFIVFLGFGFFGSQYRYFSFSSIGQTFLLAALSLQWSVVLQGLLAWIPTEFDKVHLTIPHLIEGLYAAAAVIISSGVVLGKLNARQLTLMALCEVTVYCFNWLVVTQYFNAYDTGYSMTVHFFAAVFGWVVYLTVRLPIPETDKKKSQFEVTSYNSEMFSWIGVLFLWIFWPSLNSARAPMGAQFQAAVNTSLALLASALTAFYFMHMTNFWKGNLFVSDVIRHASLAGGILMSSTLGLLIPPWLALLFGFVGGILVVLTQYYIRHAVEKNSGLKDSMGVLYLHGFVGLLSAISGMVAVAVVAESGDAVLGIPFNQLFHEENNDQPLYQLAALGTSLGFAAVGGLLTGVLIRFFKPFRARAEPDYSDHRDFLVTGDFPVFVTRDPREPGAAAKPN